MSDRSHSNSAIKSEKSSFKEERSEKSLSQPKNVEKSESRSPSNERPVPRKPVQSVQPVQPMEPVQPMQLEQPMQPVQQSPEKNPIYIQIDIEYYKTMEQDGFESLKQIIEKRGCDVLEIDESITLEQDTSRFVKIDSKDNKNKYDASDDFIDLYYKDFIRNKKGGVGITVLIPEGLVSLFIGAKGKQIKELKYKSKTKIDVCKPVPGENFRMIELWGHHEDLKNASSIINSTVFRLEQQRRNNDGNNPNNKHRDRRSDQVYGKLIIETDVYRNVFTKKDVDYIDDLFKAFGVNIRIVDCPFNLRSKSSEKLVVC